MKALKKTKTYEFDWIKNDFMIMDKKYREIRTRAEDHKCWFCGYEFYDGEMMNLGCIKGLGNRLMCDKCCMEADNECVS